MRLSVWIRSVWVAQIFAIGAVYAAAAQESVAPANKVEEPTSAVQAAAPAIAQPATASTPAPVSTDKKVAVQEQPKADAQTATKSEPMTIDTVGLEEPSGNWLFKRIWWEKAEELYDAIKTKVEEIATARTKFFTQRTELDRTVFEPFNHAVGMEQGELSVIVDYLINELDALKAREGSLTKQEQELLTLLSAQKTDLEQLQLDVKAIGQAGDNMDEALNKLNERVNFARGYEQQAWQHFRTIAKVLDEKKARALYYTMETLNKNVVDIFTYIATTFSTYFDQQAKVAKDQVTRINTTVTMLKEKGLDFAKQVKQMEQDAVARERVRTQQEKEQAVAQAIEDTTQDLSIMHRLANFWNWIVAGAQSAWDWVMSFFGGSEDESEAITAQEQTQQISVPPVAPQAQEAESAKSEKQQKPEQPAQAPVTAAQQEEAQQVTKTAQPAVPASQPITPSEQPGKV
jgi:hypothetical protein